MVDVLLPGDKVCEAEGYIKGHGTETDGNSITSTYLGRVNRINKLVTVVPVHSFRYTPEVGDVVVGRVVQICNKRWRLETNSKSDTTLSLSAINLPGVAQRRKSEDDEINMHKFFGIGDLVVCEVQKVNKNGSAALHTRNDRYGRLSNGILVAVPHALLCPLKSRFLSRRSVEIVAGCNGFVWISVMDEDWQSYVCVSRICRAIQDLCLKYSPIDLDGLVNELA